MIECVYTKDKLKKGKSWKDGYLKYSNKKFFLYDEREEANLFVCVQEFR
ncbi:hypothetical protein EDEG_01854 [Edhazardia aedis USNM 41457]|uniref:5'-3' DNA helicase ZGRF1-like N-terminal domain-containing protein n=1 Tax=Edhazardia aedis (strain USNM 41457) TaxID=1003232 RepID=J9DMP5_EDHAE|nr:hypothetical protein EDEG_01854 [Edhazardia aedis USNM 41457]|eukprot:EJW03855.1 hypothetical protein EDEG_01854 [Edhazardia aedis USNM 41457]